MGTTEVWLGQEAVKLERRRGRQEKLSLWSDLYDLGINVVPAEPRGKKPLRAWKGFQTSRQARSLFERWFFGDFRLPGTSEALLVVGDTSGIKVVVIDADDEEAMDLVEARCPPTPMRTRTARGIHYFYGHPGTGRIVQRTGTQIGGKSFRLDLKADGSVVIAPGSRHRSGHVYEMVEPWSPEMLAGLPVYDPAWLPYEVASEDKCRRAEPVIPVPALRTGTDSTCHAHQQFVRQDWLPSLIERIDRAHRYLAKVPGTTAGHGKARKECYRLALAMTWGFALPIPEAIERLQEWGRKNDQLDQQGCYDPWSEEEVAAEVRSAAAATYRGIPGDRLYG
jgi:hypothetical protein